MSRVNLEIKIELDGKVHTISISETTDPAKLARAFIKDNQLDISLIDSLANNVSNFLSLAAMKESSNSSKSFPRFNSARNEPVIFEDARHHMARPQNNHPELKSSETAVCSNSFRFSSPPLRNSEATEILFEGSSNLSRSASQQPLANTMPNSFNYRQNLAEKNRGSTSSVSRKKSEVYDRLFADATAKQKRRILSENSMIKNSFGKPLITLDYLNNKFFYESERQEKVKRAILEKENLLSRIPEPTPSFAPTISQFSKTLTEKSFRPGKIEDRLIKQGHVQEERIARSRSAEYTYQSKKTDGDFKTCA